METGCSGYTQHWAMLVLYCVVPHQLCQVLSWGPKQDLLPLCPSASTSARTDNYIYSLGLSSEWSVNECTKCLELPLMW